MAQRGSDRARDVHRSGAAVPRRAAAGQSPARNSRLIPTAIRAEHKVSVLLIKHDASVVMSISDPRRRALYGVKIADSVPSAIATIPRSSPPISASRTKRWQGRSGVGL
jgi:hypothetical protein